MALVFRGGGVLETYPHVSNPQKEKRGYTMRLFSFCEEGEVALKRWDLRKGKEEGSGSTMGVEDCAVWEEVGNRGPWARSLR